jgi:hypothetical protein
MYNLYLISSCLPDNNTYYKIGFTKRDVNKRLLELKTSNAHNLEIVETFHSRWGTKIESWMHNHYKNVKIQGEWFQLTDEDVINFKSLCNKQHDIYEMLYEENPFFKKLTKI